MTKEHIQSVKGIGGTCLDAHALGDLRSPNFDEVRARFLELLASPIEYRGDIGDFAASNAWKRIVDAPLPEAPERAAQDKPRKYADLMDTILDKPALTQEQVVYLFRKMNYLKYAAEQVRRTLTGTAFNPEAVERIDALLQDSSNIRRELIYSSLKILSDFGMRYTKGDRDAAVSEGYFALERAIDTFDYSRKSLLRSYVIQVLRNCFNDHIRDQVRHATNQLSDSEALAIEEHRSLLPAQQERRVKLYREWIENSLSGLSDRAQVIVRCRYGLHDGKEWPWKEIGDLLGLTAQTALMAERAARKRLRESVEDPRDDIL